MTAQPVEGFEHSCLLGVWHSCIAICKGVGVYFLLLILASMAITPLSITISLFWPVPFDFLASRAMQIPPIVLHAVILVVAGAFASAGVGRLKTLIAFAAGILVAAPLCLVGLAILPGGEATSNSKMLFLSGWYVVLWWVSLSVLPVVGSVIERRLARSFPSAFRVRFLARVAGGLLLYVGLFVSTSTALLFSLYPGVLEPKDHVFGIICAGAGILILAGAWFLFRHTTGIRRGLVVSPMSWLTVGLVALFAAMFILRESSVMSDRSELLTFVHEFNHRQTASHEDNGADLYFKADQVLQRNEEEFGGLWYERQYPTLEDWRKGDQPRWGECLQANNDAIQAAIEAGRKESFHFPLRLIPEGYPAAWLLWRHQHPNMHMISFLLEAKAHQAAGQRDFARALECCNAIHAMSRAYTNMPALDAITGSNRRSMAITLASHIAKDKELPEAQLEKLQDMLSTWGAVPYPTEEYWRLHAELQERWFGHQVLLEMQQSGVVSFAGSVMCTETYFRRAVWTLWNKALDTGSGSDMYERVRQWSAGTGLRASRTSVVPLTEEPAFRLMSDYAYGMLIVLGANLCEDARLNVLAGYVAARRHLLIFGSLPPSWDALVPRYIADIPEDPFSGEPLKLKASDGTVTICWIRGGGLGEAGKGAFSGPDAAAGDICLVLRNNEHF